MIDSRLQRGKRSLAPAPTNAIDDGAFAWAVKVEAAPLTITEKQALDTWLAADPRHAGAFARAQAISLKLDRAAALGSHYDPAPETKAAFSRLVTSRRMLLRGGSVMAAVAVGGIATHLLLESRGSIATSKGVVQRQPLSDGSSMVLNTASEARLAYTQDTRRVKLVSGEARFNVAKDSSRPFVVSTGAVDIRAVGTSFTVWRQVDQSTHIVVSEGVVAVEYLGRALIPHLAAGNTARVQSSGAFIQTTLSVDALERATAWTEGLIDMNGLSLNDAAVQFARYSDLRIDIGDQEIGALRVSGTYSINDPVGFARAAALSLGLEAVPQGNGILLRRKSGRAPAV